MFCELLADEGQGAPVVYLPGIDGTGRLLLGAAARLAREFRLLRLRYAATDDPAEDSYAGLAASLAGVLDEAAIDRALLLAESFGGGVALRAALDFPGRVAALAIVNSFPYYRARGRLALARLAAPLVPGFAFDHCRRRVAPWTLFGRRRDAEAIRRFRVDGGTRFDAGYRRRLRLIHGLDLRPRLRQVGQPVLLVAGDRDRVVDSEFEALYMKELLPDARLEVVAGGGHVVLPLADLPWSAWLAALARRGGLA